MLRRGHIYWVQMPGEGKRRPAVILSPDRRNDLADTVVVVPCSSVRRFGPWHVELGRGEGGLERPSVVKCEDVTTIGKHRLLAQPLGGPLSSERLEEVRDSLLRALAFA